MESIVFTTAINVAKKKGLIFHPALSLIWRRIVGRVFVAVHSQPIVTIQFAPIVEMNILLNKMVIKMKNEAYKALIDIKHIIKNAEAFIKRDLQLPPAMISELDRLGDLGKIVEAYAVATKDKDIILEIEKLQRFSLHRINAKDTTSPKTRYSIAICIRSLYNVAQMGNQDNENITLEKKAMPKEFICNKAIHKTTQMKDNGSQAKQEAKPPHYNKDNENEARKQFESLVKNGYFLSDASLDDWLYIYGIKGYEPNTKPLNWQKTQTELGYMIQNIWQDTDSKKIWAICEEVFIVKGKKPNTKSIKSMLSNIGSGLKNKTKMLNKLDEALRI